MELPATGAPHSLPEAVAPAAGPLDDDTAFASFRHYIYQVAGIRLSDNKKGMVFGRLAKRLRYHGLKSFADYYRLVKSNTVPGEEQVLVDLLTTHETHFFREPRHYEFLDRDILASHPRSLPFRFWSAACSSGEEAYSAAMLLAERLGNGPWEVVGTDISTQVLETAQAGHYPISRAEEIPEAMLKRYCLKGFGPQEGILAIRPDLRGRLRLKQANLTAPLPSLGWFDAIFLRNVLIYFDQETQQAVVSRVISHLRPGGHLFLGHAESLNRLDFQLELRAPGIFRKPDSR